MTAATVAPPRDQLVTCPRCGTEASDAPWCPECGLSLARRAPLDGPPPIAPPGWQRRSSHGRAIAAALLVTLIAAGIALIVVLSGNGHHPAPRPAPPAPKPAAAALVSDQAMHAVLQRYATAYSNESVPAMADLLAPDVTRSNGSDAPEGLTAALQTYAQQFAALSHPHYSLAGIRYAPGRGGGSAGATYRISSDTGINTGTIGFHFAETGNGVLIDAIVIKPIS